MKYLCQVFFDEKKLNALPEAELSPFHVFCQRLGAGASAPASDQGVLVEFLTGREPNNVQRQSLKLPYAGWVPHERVSSQACLGLSAGIGEDSGPRGSRGSP
jgi:hypothetical protein